jgi:hypothetical protein
MVCIISLKYLGEVYLIPKDDPKPRSYSGLAFSQHLTLVYEDQFRKEFF